jgi:transcriptional regulator with XRE-family HTH domain
LDGSLGSRLRWARSQQGITFQQLSERCDRAISYLCQLEKGNKENPTWQTVEALAAALGVRPAFLFGEVTGPRAGPIQASPESDRLGSHFRRHYATLPEAQRLDLVYGLPEQRFSAVALFLLEHFPDQFTPVELAYQLGMELRQFRHITELSGEVSHIYLEQLARVSGVPVSFFTHGAMDLDPAGPAVGNAVEYLRVIQLAQARRVSPEQLEALILAYGG